MKALITNKDTKMMFAVIEDRKGIEYKEQKEDMLYAIIDTLKDFEGTITISEVDEVR